MIIKRLFLIGILSYSSDTVFCQSSMNEYTDSCCKQTKKSELPHTESARIRPGNNQSKVIACKLTAPDLQKRKIEVIGKLKAKVITRKELPNGFSYLFAATDDSIDEISTFVKTERMCCSFFNFKISIEDDRLWLNITGERG